MSNKTTKTHFELFKKEVAKWVFIYGMKDWEVIVRHKALIKNSRGACHSNFVDRVTVVGLNPDWGETEVTNDNIRKTAFHEVTEILTSQLVALCEARFVTQDEISTANHYLIVEFRDERLTTVSARRLMQSAGTRKTLKGTKDDAIAAALILQGYLEEALST